MSKPLLVTIVFAGLFFSLYQKQQIVILAYDLDTKKDAYARLEEEKADLVAAFMKETNLASINKRFLDAGITPRYPKEHVTLVALPAKRAAEKKSSFIARVFAQGNTAQARQ
jgi:hypothetical protein